VTESEPANSTRTLDRRRGRYRPERLLTLVDGVFAISMTLLVLDVRVPDDVPDTAAAFGDNVGVLLGRLGVFVAAFLITAGSGSFTTGRCRYWAPSTSEFSRGRSSSWRRSRRCPPPPASCSASVTCPGR
jgi:hypothetical protein